MSIYSSTVNSTQLQFYSFFIFRTANMSSSYQLLISSMINNQYRLSLKNQNSNLSCKMYLVTISLKVSDITWVSKVKVEFKYIHVYLNTVNILLIIRINRFYQTADVINSLTVLEYKARQQHKLEILQTVPCLSKCAQSHFICACGKTQNNSDLSSCSSV